MSRTSGSRNRVLPPVSTSASPVVGGWEKMRGTEETYATTSKMLDNHPLLEPSMRSTLFDWMGEVCMDMLLKRETCHQALNYTDRFLARTQNCQRNRLQLVGTVSMYVSAKLEEIYPPKAAEFVAVCDGAYSLQQLLSAEKELINTLNWRLVPPTLYTWANWYSHNIGCGVFNEATRRHTANAAASMLAVSATAAATDSGERDPPRTTMDAGSDTIVAALGSAGSDPPEAALDAGSETIMDPVCTAAPRTAPQAGTASPAPRNVHFQFPSPRRESRGIFLSRGAGPVSMAQQAPAIPSMQSLSLLPRARGTASIEFSLVGYMMAILDAATLDHVSADFRPSLLAAAALFIVFENEHAVCATTRYSMTELLPALRYLRGLLAKVPVEVSMHPRLEYLRDKLPREDLTTMHTHTKGLLHRVHSMQSQRRTRGPQDSSTVAFPRRTDPPASPLAPPLTPSVPVPGTAPPAGALPAATPAFAGSAKSSQCAPDSVVARHLRQAHKAAERAFAAYMASVSSGTASGGADAGVSGGADASSAAGASSEADASSAGASSAADASGGADADASVAAETTAREVSASPPAPTSANTDVAPTTITTTAIPPAIPVLATSQTAAVPAQPSMPAVGPPPLVRRTSARLAQRGGAPTAASDRAPQSSRRRARGAAAATEEDPDWKRRRAAASLACDDPSDIAEASEFDPNV